MDFINYAHINNNIFQNKKPAMCSDLSMKLYLTIHVSGSSNLNKPWSYDHVSVGGYDERTNSEKNIVHSRISSVGFFAF